MTLTDFLLARIARDELFWDLVEESQQAHPDRIRRSRAECEAKRRIVEEATTGTSLYDYERDGSHDYGTDHALDWVCKVLALPYASHPDYREEWKP